MKSESILWKICLDIYRQMYKEATPSADFDEMMNSGEANTDGFYMNYSLPTKRQDEIIEEHCKRHRLRKYDKKQVSITVYLGCSPTDNERNNAE